MRTARALCLSCAAAQAVYAQEKPLVESAALRNLITAEALLDKAQRFEDFAYTTEERNRVVGSPGLEASLKYVLDTLTALNYYDVKTQQFELSSGGDATLSVDGTSYSAALFGGSPAGNISAPLVAAANLGCDAADYPAELAGAVALISRGVCGFAVKATLAGAAGAVGAVIYNNDAAGGPISGSLGNGAYPPTVGVSLADGQTLAAELSSGASLAAALSSSPNVIKTYNIIAQTRGGDLDNVLQLGAHMDSVEANPGINDDGSGSIGILEVAVQLANFAVNNTVRFSWWSAEEAGLVGSTHYVTSLSAEEKRRIRLYLNFDMIASVNWLYAIYASNGTGFGGLLAPPGVVEAEKMFQEYFVDVAGLNYTSFDLRKASDHGPYIDAGIPTGGLFTGGSEPKTAEQVALFGGELGAPSDPGNHNAGDNFTNIHPTPFLETTKAIAHAVALYGTSFDSLPPRP